MQQLTEDAAYIERVYLPALRRELEGAERRADTRRIEEINREIARYEVLAGIAPSDTKRHLPSRRAKSEKTQPR